MDLFTGNEAPTHDSTYEMAMERIHNQNKLQVKLAKELLAWVIHAERQLSVQEVQAALALEVGHREINPEHIVDPAEMVSVCAGLLVIDEKSGLLDLIHESAFHYFGRSHERFFPGSIHMIARKCLKYLSQDDFASGPSLSDEEHELRLQQNHLYEYAACSWGYHAQAAHLSASEVMEFLEKKPQLEAASQCLHLRDYWTIKHRDTSAGYSQKYGRNATALHLVAYFGIYEVLEEIISNGGPHSLQINTFTTLDETPLVWAVANEKEEVARLLLDHGAETEVREHETGEKLLHFTIHYARLGMAKLLIENDAVMDINCSIMLLEAMLNGDDEAGELLFESKP
jgi:hypothetical protein